MNRWYIMLRWWHIIFKVPIKKENKDVKSITLNLKFVDSTRLMNRSLLDLEDNLSEIKKQECIKCKERKMKVVKCKLVGYENNKLIYKRQECKKKSYRPITQWIERFPSTYQFCNDGNNKFALLLRKGVYTYDYTDDWERFKQTQQPLMKDFHNSLNQEHITEEDYKNAEKVWKTFNIKNLGEYHDLFVQLDTLLLADIFESFRKTCQKEYHLDPVRFTTLPSFAW